MITEEMLQLFKQYNINLLLSLDGGPESHDRFRRTKGGEGTWRQIVDLLPLLKQYQGWLGARMTVSTEAISQMRQDFKLLVELGINQFIIAPAQGARPWSKDQIKQYSYNLRNIFQDYNNYKRAGRAVYIEVFEGEVQYKGWGCRAGATSLAVAPNGDVSPCSKLLGLTDEKGRYIGGNVHSSIDYKLLIPFQKPINSQPLQCKTCTNHCTGGCYAVNFEQTGNHFTPSEENCHFWVAKQQIHRLSK